MQPRYLVSIAARAIPHCDPHAKRSPLHITIHPDPHLSSNRYRSSACLTPFSSNPKPNSNHPTLHLASVRTSTGGADRRGRSPHSIRDIGFPVRTDISEEGSVCPLPCTLDDKFICSTTLTISFPSDNNYYLLRTFLALSDVLFMFFLQITPG